MAERLGKRPRTHRTAPRRPGRSGPGHQFLSRSPPVGPDHPRMDGDQQRPTQKRDPLLHHQPRTRGAKCGPARASHPRPLVSREQEPLETGHQSVERRRLAPAQESQRRPGAGPVKGAILRLHDAEVFATLNASFHHHSAKPWTSLRLLKTPAPQIN